MKKHCLYFILATIPVLFSCDKNQAVNPTPEQKPKPEEKLKVNLGFALEGTKATDTAFETGDIVGLYMVYGTASAASIYVNNQALSYNGSQWSGDTFYWKDSSTQADFYAYSPRAAVTDMKAWTFRVQANQSTLNAHKASDLVWGTRKAVTPTEERITITTQHIMSSLSINVVPGDGFSEEELAAANVSVEIMSMKTAANVDLTSGSATASGDTGSVVPYNAGTYWRAVLVPQTVADGSQLIVVKVNGEAYTLRKGFTFESGKKHSCTVTVKKSSSGISIGLGDWETGSSFSGDAE